MASAVARTDCADLVPGFQGEQNGPLIQRAGFCQAFLAAVGLPLVVDRFSLAAPIALGFKHRLGKREVRQSGLH